VRALRAATDDLNQPWDREAAGKFNKFFKRVVEAVANAPERPRRREGSRFRARGCAQILRAAAWLLGDVLFDHDQGVFEVTHSLLGGCVVAHPYRQCDGLLLVGQPVLRGTDLVRNGAAAHGQLYSRLG
jgi:hypothetical protein